MAQTIHNSMKSSLRGGNDDEAFFGVMSGLSTEKRIDLLDAYKKIYKVDLETKVKEEFSTFWSTTRADRAVALVRGELNKASAAEIQKKIDDSRFLWIFKPDPTVSRDAIEEGTRGKTAEDGKVIRDTIKARSGLSVEQQVLGFSNNDKIAVDLYFKADHEGGDVYSLASENEKGFSRNQESVEKNLQRNEEKLVSLKARYQKEIKQDLRDDVVKGESNTFVNDKFKALVDGEKDKVIAIKLAEKIPTGITVKEIITLLDGVGPERVDEILKALANYEGSPKLKGFEGVEGIKELLKFSASSDVEKKELEYLFANGKLSDAIKLVRATRGVGTDDDVVKEIIEKNSADQLKGLDSELKEVYGNGAGIDGIIAEEIDKNSDIGFDYIEARQYGVAKTPEDQKEAIERRYNREVRNSNLVLDNWWSPEERVLLDETYKLSRVRYSEYKTAKDEGRILDAQSAETRLSATHESFLESQKSYRAARKECSDSVANSAATVTAVAAGATVSILSFGTMTPLAVGAVSTVVGGVTSLGTRYTVRSVLEGETYTTEDIGSDILSASIDGIGGVAGAKVASMPIKTLAKKIAISQLKEAGVTVTKETVEKATKTVIEGQIKKLSQRIAMQGTDLIVSNGVEGGISGGLQSALDRDVLELSPAELLAKLSAGAVLGATTGVATAGGLEYGLKGVGKVSELAGRFKKSESGGTVSGRNRSRHSQNPVSSNNVAQSEGKQANSGQDDELSKRRKINSNGASNGRNSLASDNNPSQVPQLQSSAGQRITDFGGKNGHTGDRNNPFVNNGGSAVGVPGAGVAVAFAPNPQKKIEQIVGREGYGTIVKVGREVEGVNDIKVDNKFKQVSREHLEIKVLGGKYEIKVVSKNATFVDGQAYSRGAIIYASPGKNIKLAGGFEFVLPEIPDTVRSRALADLIKTKKVGEEITIGRGSENDISFESRTISGKQMKLQFTEAGIVVKENLVVVNKARIQRGFETIRDVDGVILQNGDKILLPDGKSFVVENLPIAHISKNVTGTETLYPQAIPNPIRPQQAVAHTPANSNISSQLKQAEPGQFFKVNLGFDTFTGAPRNIFQYAVDGYGRYKVLLNSSKMKVGDRLEIFDEVKNTWIDAKNLGTTQIIQGTKARFVEGSGKGGLTDEFTFPVYVGINRKLELPHTLNIADDALRQGKPLKELVAIVDRNPVFNQAINLKVAQDVGNAGNLNIRVKSSVDINSKILTQGLNSLKDKKILENSEIFVVKRGELGFKKAGGGKIGDEVGIRFIQDDLFGNKIIISESLLKDPEHLQLALKDLSKSKKRIEALTLNDQKHTRKLNLEFGSDKIAGYPRMYNLSEGVNGKINYNYGKLATLVDENDPRLKARLDEFKALLEESKTKNKYGNSDKEVAELIFRYVQAIMKYDYAAVKKIDGVSSASEDIYKKLSRNQNAKRFKLDGRDEDGIVASLGEWVERGKGVCFEMGLFSAYLAESLQKEGIIKGKVFYGANYHAEMRGGHAWMRFEASDGKVYIVDPAIKFAGRLSQASEKQWPYMNDNDKKQLREHGIAVPYNKNKYDSLAKVADEGSYVEKKLNQLKDSFESTGSRLPRLADGRVDTTTTAQVFVDTKARKDRVVEILDGFNDLQVKLAKLIDQANAQPNKISFLTELREFKALSFFQIEEDLRRINKMFDGNAGSIHTEEFNHLISIYTDLDKVQGRLLSEMSFNDRIEVARRIQMNGGSSSLMKKLDYSKEIERIDKMFKGDVNDLELNQKREQLLKKQRELYQEIQNSSDKFGDYYDKVISYRDIFGRFPSDFKPNKVDKGLKEEFELLLWKAMNDVPPNLLHLLHPSIPKKWGNIKTGEEIVFKGVLKKEQYTNGFIDKDGRHWVPCKPGEDHGGPHFDVQAKGGNGYQNVHPLYD